jgi:hypothetical protein
VAIGVAIIGAAATIIGAEISAPKPEPPPENPMTSQPPLENSTTQINSSHGNQNNTIVEVPSDYLGTWRGTVIFTGFGLNPYAIQIGPGVLGDIIGSWQEPQCSGNVRYVSGDGPAQLILTANNNPGQCEESAKIQVERSGSTLLNVKVFSGNKIVGEGSLSAS